MIDVIKNERDDDYIYKNYPSCNELGEEDVREHSKWTVAIGARDYLLGKNELEDILYPGNTLKIMHLKQENKYGCGLYAIANALQYKQIIT